MSKLDQEIVDIIQHNGKSEEAKYICEKSTLYFGLRYFPEFFTYQIPDFHYDLYLDWQDLVDGRLNELAWIIFRESAKTTIAKIGICQAICYQKKRFINYDAYDKINAEMALFDVAVWLQTKELIVEDFGQLYFASKKEKEGKSTLKRISNFITENNVKCEAYSTQQSTRGRVWNGIRPDLYVIDDFETSKTKVSYPIMQKIKHHISELQAGLGVNGGVLYLGNYITEEGVVEQVMQALKDRPDARLRKIEVEMDDKIMWNDKFVRTDDDAAKVNREIENPLRRKISLETKKRQLDSFEPGAYDTEMMNNPTKASDLIFDRERIEYLMQFAKKPIKESAKMKFWGEFKATHRYGCGGDTAEGGGGDANALVVIDYSGNPAFVVCTFENNVIDPPMFAHEMKRAGLEFGECLLIPEINNTGWGTMVELQTIYKDDKIYMRREKDKIINQEVERYGWRSHSGNKTDIVFQLKKAVEDGELVVYDKDLLEEMKKYKDRDLRLLKVQPGITKHFDKLKACALAWEGRHYAKVAKKKQWKQGAQPPQSVYGT